MDIDEMFFDYCILLKRSSDEFWTARPSQVLYCIEKYEALINDKVETSGNVTTITSMREIAGFGEIG